VTNKIIEECHVENVTYNFTNHLRLVYKPHSVQWISPSGQSSLWATCHHIAQCSLPGADHSHAWKWYVWKRAVSHRPQTNLLLLGLAPGGGYLATHIAVHAGGLLHHLFTITPEGAVCFCGPYPAGCTRPGCYPTPCSIGVRTFLDSVNAEPRLPNQPEVS
jgi:hypothetical protein